MIRNRIGGKVEYTTAEARMIDQSRRIPSVIFRLAGTWIKAITPSLRDIWDEKRIHLSRGESLLVLMFNNDIQ